MEAMLLGPPAHWEVPWVSTKAKESNRDVLGGTYLNADLYNSVSLKYSILLAINKVSSQNEFTCTLRKDT